MLPIVFAHDGPVFVDERLHAIGIAQEFVVLRVVELQRVTFCGEPIVGFAKAKIPRIVMQAPAEETIKEATIFLGYLRKESTRPVEVVDVCAGSDEAQVNAVTRNSRGEAPVFCRVLFGCEVSAATPRFIAHTPEAHTEWIAARHFTARTPVRCGG